MVFRIIKIVLKTTALLAIGAGIGIYFAPPMAKTVMKQKLAAVSMVVSVPLTSHAQLRCSTSFSSSCDGRPIKREIYVKGRLVNLVAQPRNVLRHPIAT